MFGNKKNSVEPTSSMNVNAPVKNNVAVSNDSNGLNSLVRGTIVEGNITSESDIRVDGTIKGNLHCKSKVIIGPSGYIDGEVKCANAMIEGRFHGKLQVAELLSVKEGAEVVGDVKTGKLMIQPGAVFNVSCNMKETIEIERETIKKQLPVNAANGTARVAG